MNIVRFKERLAKNNYGNSSYAGGSWCALCFEYKCDTSYVLGTDYDSNNNIHNMPEPKLVLVEPKKYNCICEYCIEDLNIKI